MYVPQPIRIKIKTTEVGIFIGSSYYVGDLNPSGHFNRFTRPAGGGLLRLNFNSRYSVKAIASFGGIEGDDSYSDKAEYRNRNLSFKSNLMEFAVEGEFNFLPYITGNKRSAHISPYIFAGLAVYHFEPKAYYYSRWYSLQPLSTEGQGTTFSNDKRYSLTQFSIPFGVGLKINVSKHVGLNFEWGLRRTFTDYLDDVSGKYADVNLLASEKGPEAAGLSDRSLTSDGNNTGRQRGNSLTNDWYSFAGVLLTYRLKGNEDRCDVPH